MKKILFLVCLCLTTVAVSASPDITSTDGKRYPGGNGVDYVFMFNGITTQTIMYNGPLGTLIEWYQFSNGTINPIPYTTGQNFIMPEGDTGYILKVDGNTIATIWVIDYKAPTLNPITVISSSNECKSVNLNIDPTVLALTYQTPTSPTLIPILRNFNITYTTLKWAGTQWVDSIATVPVTLPGTTQIPVPAPYKATTFTLSGDQFAEDLNLTKSTISSIIYTPVAVICHETSVVQTRDAKNENERPTNAKDVSGSAPLDMIFYSNPNDPIVTFYNWEIFKDKSKTSLIGGRTTKTTPYTFNEPGSYVVKVTVSNDKACSYSDSITVTVSTSSIQAPNVFTPNGDGMNDEFRVAYKSILTFHCWVYNRWGRLVYEWTDPMKGWDGNINGKEASPGPYYYVIKATGNDGQKYKLKGDINLLR